MQMEHAPHPRLDRYYGDAEEHRRYLRSIFDETARSYDRITSLMSLGSVGIYRRDVLRRAGLEPGMRVLDVATGTGPVARAAADLLEGEGSVLGLDPSPGMLAAGLATSPRPKIAGRAEALPLADGCCDFLVMGYALRHVDSLEAAFREYRRVLRPGGRLLILELTRPRRGWRLALARLYLGRLVPALSGLLPGSGRSRELMTFYWDTIEACVPPEIIVEALESCGLREARHRQPYPLLSEYLARR